MSKLNVEEYIKELSNMTNDELFAELYVVTMIVDTYQGDSEEYLEYYDKREVLRNINHIKRRLGE